MKKKRLKKSIKIIILITLIIILTIVGILLFNYYRKLKGKMIDDYIYQYTIEYKKDDYVPTQIKDDYIYYLMNEDNIYTLYRRNIRRNEATKIGSLNKKYDYCSFDKGYIDCAGNGEDYYDYKLNLVFNTHYTKGDPTDIIYYQGKLCKLINKKIYDENDNVIKELKFDFPEASLFGDYTIKNKTFIIFYSMKERTYLYYDTVTDIYEIKDELLNIRYDEGFYSILQGNVVTYNFLTNKITKYTDLNINEYARATLINNNIFYFIENNQLYALDLNNKSIERYEHKYDKEISYITYMGDYIYLTSYNEGCTIYVIDKNKANKTSYKTLNEYKEYMNKYLDNKVMKLEKKFHVDIVYKDEVNIQNETFKTTVLDNIYTINTSLDIVEVVLNKFNTEFFDKFREDNNKGIVIYLANELIPMQGANTTAYPSGYTIANNKEYGVIVDGNGYGLKATLCHEIMHNSEFKMKTNLYTEWFKKNPKNFEYQYSYTTDADNKYTIGEDDKNNVYFFDSYAKSYPMEDVARIFENICDRETDSNISNYPHLYDKAIYLKETLEKEFPSLKEATVFNSLTKKNKTT